MGAQKNKSDGEKKDDGLVVLKMDLHCAGCITKYKKVLGANLEGLVSVKADLESNKITIVGKVDPVKAKEILEQRSKKNVEIISPAPKKKENGGGGEDNKSEEKTEKKADDKKAKEPPPLTMAVWRVNLHCEGCIQKIYKTVTKTEGFHEIKFDREKDLVMVKGTMDMKMLAETLELKLKRNVEVVVIPNKETAGAAAGENKEKGGGGGGGGGEKDKGKGDGATKAEERQVPFYPFSYGYGYGYPVHPVYGYPSRYTAPQPSIPGGWGNFQNPPGFAFSDENPNACFIM